MEYKIFIYIYITCGWLVHSEVLTEAKGEPWRLRIVQDEGRTPRLAGGGKGLAGEVKLVRINCDDDIP